MEKSLLRSLCGAMLLLSGLSAQALNVHASRVFDLLQPENAGGAITLSEMPLQYTQVRATFTALVMSEFQGGPAVLSDYALLSREQSPGDPTRCTQRWCIDEHSVFERSAITTMVQSESWLNAAIGKQAGRSSTADVPALTRQDLLGTTSDRVEQTHSVEPFAIRYDSNGNIIDIEYADWFRTSQYQTRSLTRWEYSPVTMLSVTLDLGSDELAALSGSGTLNFSTGYASLIETLSLRLDYEAVSSVPEAPTALQLALGLALGLPLLARRRRQA